MRFILGLVARSILSSVGMCQASSGLSSDVSDAGLSVKRRRWHLGRMDNDWRDLTSLLGTSVALSLGNWVAEEVGELILLGMECPVAASCSRELSGVLDLRNWVGVVTLYCLEFLSGEFVGLLYLPLPGLP
ncbi:hypothetical protein Tco_1273176 [Tanacetum coccineum]